MDISKNKANKKDPEEVFKAFANTLEVLISHCNHIDETYSDTRQGEHETMDQLDECIKALVEKCGFETDKEKKT